MLLTEQSEKDNTEAHIVFDERIRDIEVTQASVLSTMQSMNANIGDMKNMFQKFIDESSKIVTGIADKYSGLHDRFILVEYECKNCEIKQIVNKVSILEGERFSKLESSVQKLEGTKAKFSSFWGQITISIVTVFILYLLYIVAVNINTHGNIIANPPDVKKSGVSFVTDAIAGPIQKQITSSKGQ